MTKKQLRKEIKIDVEDRVVVELIDDLKASVDRLRKWGSSDRQIRIDLEMSEYYDSVTSDPVVYAWRQETDEEYHKRLARQKEIEKNKAEDEKIIAKRKYEELKKRFENE